MPVKDEIIRVAESLIKNKGFNAFSYYDISRAIGIKTASIHYHFPTKTDLGVAAIKEQIGRLIELKTKLEKKSPVEKLKGFMSVYTKLQADNNVCFVGSLATDINTVDKKIHKELKRLADMILDWLTEILIEGKSKKIFHFSVTARSKALLIATNMLGSVQLARLTGEADFMDIKNSVLKDLLK